MMIGLSTYAFFWQWHETADRPLSLSEMIDKTAELGGGAVPDLRLPADRVGYADAELAASCVRTPERLGVALELGTRGVTGAVLDRYLELAQALDVTLVRSMINTADHRPSADEAVELLGRPSRRTRAAGVTVALETYEQVPVDTLGPHRASRRLAGSRHLPRPRQLRGRAGDCRRGTIERTAPYVRNLHVKDFAFSRKDGWVGFTFAGCPLGEGLLDYDFMIDAVRPDERGINQIIEHWLPWQGDSATTHLDRDQWNVNNLSLPKEQSIVTVTTPDPTTQQLNIAVIGAGGKMGMRVSNNLQRSDHNVYYSENSPAGQQRTTDAGRDGHRHRHRRRRGRRGDPGRAGCRPRPGVGGLGAPAPDRHRRAHPRPRRRVREPAVPARRRRVRRRSPLPSVGVPAAQDRGRARPTPSAASRRRRTSSPPWSRATRRRSRSPKR